MNHRLWIVLLTTFALAGLGPRGAGAAIPESERDALIALYISTNGDSWGNSTGWLGDPGTECGWAYVTCDSGETMVTELDLYNRGLTGSLPAEIAALTHLQILDLSYNQIEGTIPPEIGSFSELEFLFLSGNRFTGVIPPEIGNLGALTHLVLGIPTISGGLPPEIGNLTALQYLELRDLNGPIPPELGNLVNLETLRMSGCEITAPIPDEIGDLASLKWLYLSSNEINGPLPPGLGSLASIEYIYLNDSGITGSIPPEIGSLTTLLVFDLRTNRLTGEIPPEIGGLDSLAALYLQDNSLSGEIPTELAGLPSIRTINLTGNELTGGIPPELGNLGDLYNLSLSDNHLSGTLPPELAGLAGLYTLELSSNQIGGEIPASFADFCGMTNVSLEYNGLWTSDPSLAAIFDTCGSFRDWRIQGIPPADLHVVAATPRFVTMEWTPITWTEDGTYEVLVGTTPGGPYRRIPSTALLFDKGVATAIAGPLEPGSSYVAVVRSMNYANRYQKNNIVSTPSAEVAFSTPPATVYHVAVSGSDQNDCLTPSSACRFIQTAINKTESGDTVRIGPGTFSENLTIDRDLVIEGATSAPTIVDGLHLRSAVAVGSGVVTALDRLIISNGEAGQGGGVFNGGGTVFVLSGEISGNRATADGGAIHNRGGAVVVEDSTIAENTAGSDAVVSQPLSEVQPGSVGFRSSTLSGNIANDIFSRVMGPVTLMNSTVTDNRAGSRGYIIEREGSRFLHAIVAANHSPNCVDVGLDGISLGRNVTDSEECFRFWNRQGDLVVTDAMLGPLADHGGPTRTHPLLPSSPAIDAGINTGSPTHDQRGFIRLVDGDGDGIVVVDAGAYEYGSLPVWIFGDGFESGDPTRWSSAVPEGPPDPGSAKDGHR